MFFRMTLSKINSKNEEETNNMKTSNVANK